MPKRCANILLDIPQKPPYNYPAVCAEQEEYIYYNSFVLSFLCEHYLFTSQEYMIDRTHYYSKYTTCTHQGCLCKKEFYTIKE